MSICYAKEIDSSDAEAIEAIAMTARSMVPLKQPFFALGIELMVVSSGSTPCRAVGSLDFHLLQSDIVALAAH